MNVSSTITWVGGSRLRKKRKDGRERGDAKYLYSSLSSPSL